jgi:hypothetical protein
MDNDNDHDVDYNDVVSCLENCRLSKTTEDQAKNNQLFWSIIDQHKVSAIASRHFFSFLTFLLFLCLFSHVYRKEK